MYVCHEFGKGCDKADQDLIVILHEGNIILYFTILVLHNLG